MASIESLNSDLAMASKRDLRLFDRIGGSAGGGHAAKAAQQQASPPAHWGTGGALFRWLTGRHDRELARLFLHCLAAPEDRVAAALLAALTGGSAPAALRALLRAAMEAPCWGVTGLTNFAAARTKFVQAQLAQGLEGGVSQVVILGCGFSSLPYQQPTAPAGVTFFEVDGAETLRRKRGALERAAVAGALPTGAAAAGAAGAVRFVEVDPRNWAQLLPQLMAAGYVPERRSLVVAEGLFYLLPQAALSALLADLSVLCAPGSRLVFDTLDQRALEGSAGSTTAAAPPGFATFAAALGNKGSPVVSGIAPSFSALVRLLAPHAFRPDAYLPPAEAAKQLLGVSAWDPARPCLPPYLTLCSALKASPLLLRHAPGEHGGSGSSEVEALPASAVTGGSCLFGGLLAMLFGSGRSEAAAGPQRPASSSSGREAAALQPPTMPSAPAPPLIPVARPHASQPGTPAAAASRGRPSLWGQRSVEEWTLRAAGDGFSTAAAAAAATAEPEHQGLPTSTSAESIEGGDALEGSRSSSGSSSRGGGLASAEREGGGSSWWSFWEFV